MSGVAPGGFRRGVYTKKGCRGVLIDIKKEQKSKEKYYIYKDRKGWPGAVGWGLDMGTIERDGEGR